MKNSLNLTNLRKCSKISKFSIASNFFSKEPKFSTNAFKHLDFLEPLHIPLDSEDIQKQLATLGIFVSVVF